MVILMTQQQQRVAKEATEVCDPSFRKGRV